MIVVKLQGRLGNQMFQYALAKKFQSIGKDVALDCELLKVVGNDNELVVFPNIHMDRDIRTATIDEINQLGDFNQSFINKLRRKMLGCKKTYIKEKANCFQQDIYQINEGYLEGYWQTEKYFQGIAAEVREKFEFPDCDVSDVKNRKVIDDIMKYNSVSIHIRRGDYLKSDISGMYGGICTKEYYDIAIKYFCQKYEGVRFYIFSDDPVWAKEQYGRDDRFQIIDFNTGNQSYRDMQLMSLCHHNIIANSSFSWWGAWLNKNSDKEVIAPGKWLNGEDTPDIWCEGWKRIG